MTTHDPHRRALLRALTRMAAVPLAPALLASCGNSGPAPPATGTSALGRVGPLLAPDANGLRLPAGFASRIVARAGERLTPNGYAWHEDPDGGAVFAMADGGWVYVSNSERSNGAGGVGALRFDRSGAVSAQYAICSGTSRNCAGGPTPWGTWLTCEEVADGRVWECSVTEGGAAARALPALGRFNHEAAAVDAAQRHVYLTEDARSGALFRFVPSATDWPAGAARGQLDDGRLQLLQVTGGGTFPPADGRIDASFDVGWVDWPAGTPRPSAAIFDGGEGIWLHAGLLYFATKGDNRVWRYDTARARLSVIYDDTMPGGGTLTGVDNVVADAAGDVLVAEDGGDMQIVVLTTDGKVVPLLQVADQPNSEITGPAFSPDGKRLYFSSQRGPGAGGRPGITYEVTGPFTA